MLILAFDTATDLATSALVADGETLGERTTRPQALLADVDALLVAARFVPADLTAIVVGTGPGSFTGTRIGLSVARGLALSLDLPVAGVSTLAALAAGTESAPSRSSTPAAVRSSSSGRSPCGPRTSSPRRGASASAAAPAATGIFSRPAESRFLPTTRDLHVPRASLHASIASSFGPGDAVAPVYVRDPDAKRWTG